MRGNTGTIRQNRKTGPAGGALRRESARRRAPRAENVRTAGVRGEGGRRGNGLLTGLAFFAGALAVYKRIPLTNRIGDNGNAYFGMAYDTWLFFFLLCGYAMQAVVARMTAARYAKGQYRNTRRVWNAALLYTAVLGIAGTAAMLLSAGVLSAGLFQTKTAAVVIRSMAPAVFISSLLGALRGYFQGMGSMVPTAISRFVEELAGLLLMFTLVSGMGDYGKKVGALLFQPDYEQAFGAAGAVFAFWLGGLISLLFLALLYFLFQGSFRRRERKDAGKGTEDYRRIGRLIAGAALPVVLTGFAMQGSYILDQILFLQLMSAGSSSVAQWGIYTGKYRILSGIPVMLAAAACTGLIPSLSASVSGMNMGRAKEKAFFMLKLSFSVSLPLAVYLAVTADNLVPALFTAGEMATAAGLLRIGSAAMVLQALAVGISCVLQGLERQRLLLGSAGISLLLHIILMFAFLNGLKCGVEGVVYAVTGLYAAFVILGMLCVLRTLSLKGDWGRAIGIPLISSAVMGLVVYLMNRFLAAVMSQGLLCLLCFAAGLVIYVLLMLSMRAMTQRELKSIPGGGVFIAVGRLFRFL